jgi:hypothetical protein
MILELRILLQGIRDPESAMMLLSSLLIVEFDHVPQPCLVLRLLVVGMELSSQ